MEHWGCIEQEELVQVLQEQCTAQSRLWQRLFGCVALIGGLFFLGAALHHTLDPWSTVRPPTVRETALSALEFYCGQGNF
jgi:hypothetical protein